MSLNRIEIHPCGLAVFTAAGECIATVTLTSGVGDATLLVLAKDAPALEITLDHKARIAFEEVVHRVNTAASMAAICSAVAAGVTPRVPRFEHPRSPHLPG